MIRPAVISSWANDERLGRNSAAGKSLASRVGVVWRALRSWGASVGPAVILCLAAILGMSSLAWGQKVSLSPASETFTNQVVNTSSAAKVVTLTNTGTALLTLTVSISGDYAQTNTCGTSVAAGAKCTISVTFTPIATGSRTGTLTFTDNASGSPQTLNLSGTGVIAVVVTPTTIAFSGQFTGTTSAPKVANLTNNESVGITITSIAVTGDFGETNTCGASLAAGTKCSINITFSPTAVGARAGTLTISDSGTNSPQVISL
jgi:hypothetical protein